MCIQCSQRPSVYLFHLFFRARYSRNRTRFVTIPAELDCNSRNTVLLNAALAAGLYPKILAIDSSNGHMRTITNNQAAAFHPSSVNFRKNAVDFGIHYLSYFTLMWVSTLTHLPLYLHYSSRQSKKLYVWETGPVDDMAMLLLCGECDFKVRYAIVQSNCLTDASLY